MSEEGDLASRSTEAGRAEDIRRAGVTSLPEALRLAPGVEVTRGGAHSWTISLRGFNRDLSNKLLVLIDARSVYSLLYAGVFWDVQDTLIADIERIEIVTGPGGTLWGANAVNGVINVITRSPRDAPGGLVQAGTGTERRLAASARFAGLLAARERRLEVTSDTSTGTTPRASTDATLSTTGTWRAAASGSSSVRLRRLA